MVLRLSPIMECELSRARLVPVAPLYLREAEALHAGVELAAAQAEQLGRFRAVLAGLLERALDERALHRLQVHPLRREGRDTGRDHASGGGGRRGRWGRTRRRLGGPRRVFGLGEAPLPP